jgi:hypothetical protein
MIADKLDKVIFSNHSKESSAHISGHNECVIHVNSLRIENHPTCKLSILVYLSFSLVYITWMFEGIIELCNPELQ